MNRATEISDFKGYDMGLNDTPSAERPHIAFFGVRNAGKSSVVNRITNQPLSIVSDVKGTTTDSVKKPMELLPLGAVIIIDTPGIDDEGELGEMRVQSALEMLKICDIAVLVTENEKLNQQEVSLLAQIKKRDIPYLIVHNKSDLLENVSTDKLYVSAKTGYGINELKEAIAKAIGDKKKELHLVSDFTKKGDTVVFVTPIDSSAPKGRLIMPQQLAIRETLDSSATAVVVQTDGLAATLDNLKTPPRLVVCDSQVFKTVMSIVPRNIPLTSFSILMARYKGFLSTAVNSAKKLDELSDGARILIAEGCTHHRQCEDIGTVKLPRWLQAYTGKKFNFEFTSGHGFPKDLSPYDMVIHCGACMLNDNEVQSRMNEAADQSKPFTNYGTVIAKVNGILDRSLEITKT